MQYYLNSKSYKTIRHLFDTGLIFSRVIGVQASSFDVGVKQLLLHGLLPVFPFLFLQKLENNSVEAVVI